MLDGSGQTFPKITVNIEFQRAIIKERPCNINVISLQNCSDLPWEQIVLVIEKNRDFAKVFETTKVPIL